MFVTLCRTLILFVFVIIGMRIMGKRQIGDMQPNELVTTILISEIATIPIQDIKQPVINGVIAILLLVSLEVLISFVAMKSDRIRRMIDGRPTIIIRHGEIDQTAMKNLRLTVDDLLENLRQEQVFRLDDVEYAIIETNGHLSVMLKPSERPYTAGQAEIKVCDEGIQVPVICDGKLRDEFMRSVGMTKAQLDLTLKQANASKEDIFLMTVDAAGEYKIIKKEDDQ